MATTDGGVPADATDGPDAGHDDSAKTTELLLKEYWAPPFLAPDIDSCLADVVTRVFVPPMRCDTWRTPRTTNVVGALRSAKDSAPGPDGIPYSGWRNTDHDGHAILARLTLDLAAG